jgi:hypothetical protein
MLPIQLTSEYYYFLLLSIISTKIYDIFYIICSGIFHFILWEKEKISNADTNTKAFCNNILMEISKTYYISTNGKTRYNNMIIPIGFVIGKGGYIAYIEHNVDTKSNSWTGICDIFITIQIYGWWSTKLLYKSNVLPAQTNGKYKLIMGSMRNDRMLTLNIPDCHFHKNSIKCAELISKSLSLTMNNTGVYLLYGTSGTGKTKTGLYLVNFLDKNTEIHSYINCESDSFMEEFYISHYQSKVKDIGYYVLIIDEVDEMLHKLYKQSIKCNGNNGNNGDNGDKNQTQNLKQRWNNFMDYIHYMNNVVIILTTNKPKSYFDEIDESLFREYRITSIYEFKEDDVFKI